MKKWREFPKKVYFQESKIYNFFKHLDIEPTELERLKRLYRGDSKKRQSLKEGSFKLKCVGFFWRYYLALILFVEIQTKNISWCTHFTLGYYGMFVLLWFYLLRKMWFLHVRKWTLRYVFLLFSLLFWATWVTFIFVRKIDADFFLSYSCKNNCQNSCTYFHLIFLCNLSKNYILKNFFQK